MNAIENWADVEELIRSLLPPKSLVDGIRYDFVRLTPEESEWLQRVEAARVSLGEEKQPVMTEAFLSGWLQRVDEAPDEEVEEAPCIFCATRELLRTMMSGLEGVPEINSSLYDDAISDAYNALDNAQSMWMCLCGEAPEAIHAHVDGAGTHEMA